MQTAFKIVSEEAHQDNISGAINLEWQPGVSFVSWVENLAKDPMAGALLQKRYERKLGEAGLKETDDLPQISQPDHNDKPHIYLMKATIAYIGHVQKEHNQTQTSFSKWLVNEGKLWFVNDALTQTLTKATHTYSHAAADIDGNGKTRYDERQMLATFNP